jgi:hypothetical protein
VNGRVISLGSRGFPFFYENFFYGKLFYEKPRPSDTLTVLGQMRGHKFDASLILGTASRCRFHCPRVIVCSPLQGLTPFPTSFWLTCPWLARLAGTLESKGGVGELERWIQLRAPDEWIPFNIEHQRIRLALLPRRALSFLRRHRPQVFRRLRDGGAGGIRYDTGGGRVRIKCLHLQTASWLALGRHPGAAWLRERGADQDCCGRMKNICEPHC